MAAKTKKTDTADKPGKPAVKNPVGRPTDLNEELSAKIIADVREFISVNHAAEAHCVPRTTVQTWIAHGYDDLKAGIDSIFSRFTTGIKQARAEFTKECITELRIGNKNWQSNAWLLERCCAEDFGKDSELYKQLLEDYKMLMQALIDQKGVNHG